MQNPKSNYDLPTTKDFYEMLKSLSGKDTAYGVAKHFGFHQNTVRRWEKGHSILDDDHIEQVAQALSIDPGYVAACVSVERIKNATLAKSLRDYFVNHSTAAVLFLAVFTGSFDFERPAVQVVLGPNACILCKMPAAAIDRFIRAFLAALSALGTVVAHRSGCTAHRPAYRLCR